MYSREWGEESFMEKEYEDNKTFCNRFASDLLRAFYDDKTNTILSPWSVLSMLMLTADATSGATRDEVIRFTGGGRILKSGSESSDKFLSANAICSNKQMKPAFRTRHKDEMISSDELEEWVSKHSAGMIEFAIPENASTVLLNTTRFTDSWMDGYEDIKERNFYNSDGTITKVPMMCSTEYGYLEPEGAEGFAKWYEGGCLFLALMPRRRGKKAMKDFLHNLDLNDVFNHCDNIDEVHVSIPEFQITYEAELKDFFIQRDVKIVFTEEADFSPMSYDHIQLNNVIHKTHIEVDREGTRAAGFSAGLGITGPPMERKKRTLTLNRPFVYVILHGTTKTPIFAGVVNKAGGKGEHHGI